MTNWKLPDGRACPADKVGLDKEMVAAISSREGLLHTLGNLTLITVPGNTAASNSAFKEKAPWLKQSLLALNLDILDQTSWDEVEIRNRADRLADLAVKVWAYPAP
ncbi:MAG: HNH endonuclease [Proteobacteria bacterium]|nr:HNH endonuclease [Pseudomonadota bacterium]